MRIHDDAVRGDLRAIGFDPGGPGVATYVRARGWKVNCERLPDGPAPARVLLIDHDGEVVGHGWDGDEDGALLAAFADYLDHADAV